MSLHAGARLLSYGNSCDAINVPVQPLLGSRVLPPNILAFLLNRLLAAGWNARGRTMVPNYFDIATPADKLQSRRSRHSYRLRHSSSIGCQLDLLQIIKRERLSSPKRWAWDPVSSLLHDRRYNTPGFLLCACALTQERPFVLLETPLSTVASGLLLRASKLAGRAARQTWDGHCGRLRCCAAHAVVTDT